MKKFYNIGYIDNFGDFILLVYKQLNSVKFKTIKEAEDNIIKLGWKNKDYS